MLGAAAVLLLGGPAAADVRWRAAEPRPGDPEGYTLYVEETDAAYPGFKAEVWLDADPEEAASTLMVLMTDEDTVPDGQTRRVLRRGSDALVLHTRIDMPVMVADRDLVVRISHRVDPETGVHRIEWASAADEAPPPASGVVRIREASGYWELVPEAPGRTRATYLSHADVGGWLPARIVSPLMRGQVAGDVARLQRALRTFDVSAPPAP